MFIFLNILKCVVSGLGFCPLEAQSCGMIKELPYFQGGKAGRTGCQARFGVRDFFGFIGNDGTLINQPGSFSVYLR